MTRHETFEFDPNGALLRTHLPLPGQSGKVRDVYDLGEHLLIVSTDRISAFDWILPNGIPNKGSILTAMSRFWFDYLQVPHHLISCDVPQQVIDLGIDPAVLQSRIMVVRKAQVVPFECVIRGFIEGSGWAEYQQNGAICGIPLPAGLQQCDRLPEPIFTPATKAETGHDENVSSATMASAIGEERTELLRRLSLQVYTAAADHAASRGILIADTKFEWGVVGDDVILIDEVLTPDSSRFWPKSSYEPGHSQPSFDKQFVREWLSQTSWDRNSPPPTLPADVVRRTGEKYQEALDILT
ncbi:Phosphoribosylaminoimidazole-succinocarboxamide synthase [Rosistilla carotiformis]|uniref:Phosphoribosylaminoimidazole-succinocarboxamide synthase n=1 Tax=Rosistilla carotiformis TaxID=2528017 RepID=A0A518JVN9_9BACT|nr:phosphoribosylaminoimidazolesuccinocarboxamide synthase [Rosistilla carotiformis]QDV69598.1 Phosphoribosylaminoimidazole-succinocarboxamide synthase [Rosistilla carotiformis]